MSMKALELASECLKKTVEEQDENHRESLMFQFCRQIQRYCKLESEHASDEVLVKKFQGFSRQFDAFAKIYRAKDLLRKVKK